MNESPRVLGVVGGLGPESTIVYYCRIISRYRGALQTKAYPRLVLNSIDLTRVLDLAANACRELINYLIDAINNLARAGADFALIASNTPHIVFEDVEHRSLLPLISITDATLTDAERRGLRARRVVRFSNHHAK